MGMSEFYGVHEDQESIATIHRALDLGLHFLDSADLYGCGENEPLVVHAIKGRRAEVILLRDHAIEKSSGLTLFRIVKFKLPVAVGLHGGADSHPIRQIS